MNSDSPTIAEVAGRAYRFLDHQIIDAGIRDLFTSDTLWQAWLDVEVALAAAEAEVGIIPAEAAEAIAACGSLELLERTRILAAMRKQGHPIVPLISELVRVVGPEAGGWVHWGATSQNIMQSGNAVILGRAHGILAGLISECLIALADLAERGADLCMAGRTHGQHAVPITFGFKVATWIDDVLRNVDRLNSSVRPCLRGMLGGAVGAYASLGEQGPKVQARMVERLGLDPMPVPSRALIDPLAAYISDLALLSASFARIAIDVETMMQTEFGEVSEPVPIGSVGSSTMPHKRNPKLCADVIDLSAEIRSIAPLALEALIRPHEADGGATAAMDTAIERSTIAMGDLLVRMRMMLSGLELFPDRMRSNLKLSGDLIGSEAVMLALGSAIGREQAHHVVYELAMCAEQSEASFLDLLLSDRRVTDYLGEDTIRQALDPAQHVGLAPQLAREAAERVTSLLGR